MGTLFGEYYLQCLQFEEKLFIVAGLGDLTYEIVIAAFVLVTAVNPVRIEGIASHAVIGADDIDDSRIRWIAGSFKTKGLHDLQFIGLVILAFPGGKAFRRPAEFVIHFFKAQDLQYFRGRAHAVGGILRIHGQCFPYWFKNRANKILISTLRAFN